MGLVIFPLISIASCVFFFLFVSLYLQGELLMAERLWFSSRSTVPMPRGCKSVIVFLVELRFYKDCFLVNVSLSRYVLFMVFNCHIVLAQLAFSYMRSCWISTFYLKFWCPFLFDSVWLGT